MTWTLREIAMVIVGVLMALPGGWLLTVARKPADSAGKPRQSDPTRVTIALVMLIGGYHLAVWAMPPHWVPVQLNRSFWYVWVVGGLLAVLAALWMDHLDRPSGGDPHP